jgi:hypothetical protein
MPRTDGNSGALAQPRPRGSEALQRLTQGEISLEAYLDERADAAVSHLRNFVTADELLVVRDTIRGELTSDPELVELVWRTTRQKPQSATDDH